MNSEEFELSLRLFPIHPQTGNPTDWSEICKIFPAELVPRMATSRWRVGSDEIAVEWKTEIGTAGAVKLPRSRNDTAPSVSSTSMSWREFSAYVRDLEPYQRIFRGQTDSTKRLRTAFHRTGRANLLKFMNQDIPELYNLLTSHTRHIFKLENAADNGAFYSLAQHHGYPTPLLDWTHSPFISAYFAYKSVKKNDRKEDKRVRIFVFDRKSWEEDFSQIQKLSPARPHFSVLAAWAIDNPRILPQQGLFTVTNIDDIETYIAKRQEEKSKTYLTAIDLPSTERSEVMQELALMGITAGSLMPGLDGACEQLRERYFDL